MNRWITITAATIAILTTTIAQAEEAQQSQDVTEERAEAVNVELDVDDVIRLEAAVKKVEDELRGNEEFIIEARRVPDVVLEDANPGKMKIQIQRDANDVARKADQLQGLKWSGDHEREKGAFLGISGGPVTDALREQLKLPRGVGLVVEHVQPKSAADQAGVRRFDVLQKLDDQLIINAHQLAVLVRMHEPGEEVKLTVIRGGERKELTAKLTEADLEPLGEEAPWGLFPRWQQDLKDAIKPENQVRLAVPRVGRRGVLTRVREKDGSQKVVAVDDQHTLILVRQGDARELRILDRNGNELFRGPLNKDEDLQKLPRELGKKALPLWGSLREDGEGTDVKK